MSSASSSRSTTSSPDVLGPEGDALYLISSPVPNFSGRQSWVPRYTLHTPRRKERLPGRSPSKTAQTIHFDDIVLPPKSPMSVASRQRSISPTKMQSEGNLSPWRIRVTVEAEQDEDENAQGSPRKKLKPSTITTKVPLKDEEWNPPSSKKRRGRPRKSDVQDQNATPKKGSPGHTPKPKASTSGKRQRGRPRKSSQSNMVAQSIETDEAPVTSITSPNTMDDVVERKSPVPFMEADGASFSDTQSDSDPFLDIVESGTLTAEQRSAKTSHRFTPPSASENLQSESTKPVRVVEGTSELTPIKTLSAARRVRAVSPENTMHAGHTPRPRRSYPTPASSSLVDENQGNSKALPHHDDEKVPTITDPTEEHHEFDTIMESEGFSMVSLESLPSAKQAGFSSILNSAKGALKPFLEKQNALPFDKKPKSPETSDKSIHDLPATSTGLENTSDFYQSKTTNITVTRGRPTARSSERHMSEKVQTFPSLARIVRIGLALQHTMRPQRRGYQVNYEGLINSRKRLERTFSDFNPHIQRQLKAGLKFGEQLARNQIEAENYREEEKQIAARSAQVRRSSSVQEPASLPRQKPIQEHSSARQAYSNMAQREAEWQQEREEVSRKIEMAASSDVIVLESDEDAVSEVENEDQESLLDEEDAEDTNYGDIWQQEAKSHEWNSDKRSDRYASQTEDQASFQSESPEPAEQNGISTNYSTYYDWNPDRGELPPLGRSRAAQLRDEEVDLSLLLKPRDTPKSKKYYANSSPHTVASQQAQSVANGTNGVQSVPSSVHSKRPSSKLSRLENGDRENINSDEVIGGEAAHDEKEYEMHASNQTATPEHASYAENPAITPNPGISVSRPSWFRRFTNNFTPGWWAKPEKEQFVETDKPLDESFSPPFNGNSNVPYSPILEATPNLKRPREPEPELSSPVDGQDQQAKKPRYRTRAALATSGYFTDAHYVALKRLYSLAKRSPEQFPYHPNPRRDEMIGDSLWTSDGEHGLPIAEIQFGILDRFVSELAEADIQNGGTGEIGWTEDDLHKRLFSIIVGEQIRKEQKEQQGRR